MTTLRALTALVATAAALTAGAGPADAARATPCTTTIRDGATVGGVDVFSRHGDVTGLSAGEQRIAVDGVARDAMGGLRYRLAKDVQLVQWWAMDRPFSGGAGSYVPAEQVDRTGRFAICAARRF